MECDGQFEEYAGGSESTKVHCHMSDMKCYSLKLEGVVGMGRHSQMTVTV